MTFLFFLLPLLVCSQEIERTVIATSGNFSESGISIGFTIGETATSFTLESDFHYTEGFQQGEYTPIIVPVELMSFEAIRFNDRQAKINWKTASEINNNGFYIERRNEDEMDFREVGFIEGQVQSTDEISYEFLDINTEFQNTYYRLRQVDLDGTYTYTEIKIVPPVKKKTTVSLAPNPAKDELFIQLSSNYLESELKYELFNMEGTLVLHSIIEIQSPNDYFPIRLNEDIPQGIYFLKIVYGKEQLDLIQFIKS